jgi:hypothetical protein
MAKEQKMVLIQSAVREIIGEHKEFRCGGDFLEAFNLEVIELLKKSIKRTEANGKKTVGPESL